MTREETKRLHDEGYEPILKHSRYSFLKRPSNLTPKQSEKLTEVLQYDLKTTRVYFLKEAFDGFCQYNVLVGLSGISPSGAHEPCEAA